MAWSQETFHGITGYWVYVVNQPGTTTTDVSAPPSEAIADYVSDDSGAELGDAEPRGSDAYYLHTWWCFSSAPPDPVTYTAYGSAGTASTGQVKYQFGISPVAKTEIVTLPFQSFAFSVTADWTPPKTVPDDPVAPTVKGGVASVSVSVPSPNNNGATINDADWQTRPSGESAWSDHDYAGALNVTTLSGLTPATSHDVRVRFGNVAGKGGWSPTTTALTLGGGFLVMG